MLDHDEIARLIPHHGSMVLLSKVLAYDDSSITCEALSHTSKDNPLRCGDELGAACLVEYAAQALAVHARLIDPDLARSGMLATLRNVQLHRKRIDDLQSALRIVATRMRVTADAAGYSFEITCDGRAAAAGRLMIALGKERTTDTETR